MGLEKGAPRQMNSSHSSLGPLTNLQLSTYEYLQNEGSWEFTPKYGETGKLVSPLIKPEI